MKLSVRLISRWLLALSSFILATGAAIHALAYPSASAAADHSALPSFFAAALKALWLSDSVSSLMLAIALAIIAARPHLAGKPLIMALGIGPLCMAAVLFSTMGNFVAGYLMIVAGAAAVIGALLPPMSVGAASKSQEFTRCGHRIHQ